MGTARTEISSLRTTALRFPPRTPPVFTSSLTRPHLLSFRLQYTGDKTTTAPNMNSFAYDKDIGAFFFMNTDGTILVWLRQASEVGELAPASAVATYGNPSNAGYYKSAYWFIVTNSPSVKATSIVISRVAYDPPTAFGALPTLTSVTNYTINIQTAAGAPFQINNGYGDIAFTSVEAGGSLYLVTNIYNNTAGVGAPLLVVKNVDAAIASGQPWTATAVRQRGLPSLQLSYNCDETVLWGTNAGTREWGTLNTTTGALTVKFTGTVSLRDIGGAACTSATTCPCLTGAV